MTCSKIGSPGSGTSRMSPTVGFLGLLVGEELEPVLEVVILAWLVAQIHVQVLGRIGVDRVDAFAGQLVGQAAVEPDVERRQALLPVEDRRQLARVSEVQPVVVPVLPLVPLEHELVEVKLLGLLGRHLPEQERADRVAAQDAVEQPGHPLRLLRPDQLALDRWQDEPVLSDVLQRVLDRQRDLIGHGTPL